MIRRHTSKPAKNKRQWGAESRRDPLSIFHEKPSTRKIAFSRVAIIVTILLWALYIVLTVIRQFFYGYHTFGFSLDSFFYLITVTSLMLSSLLYLVTRQGAFQRFAKHVRVPRAKLEQYFTENSPSITVLIPSYSEEPEVVRKTILSAALQEYPAMRVVLLLDDNPNPSDLEAREKLQSSRELAGNVMEELKEPRERALRAFALVENEIKNLSHPTRFHVQHLIQEYEWHVEWLHQMASREQNTDHVDDFFIQQVILGLANDLNLMKAALQESLNEEVVLPSDRLLQLYRRLSSIFNSDITYFERKEFASLSHEANKAMNLNAYIGLMGGNYEIKKTPDGKVLIPTTDIANAEMIVPNSDYLLTLDADSILLKEYCLRLVYFLEQPDNKQVAVTQTPYSSFRGASTRLERLAGATTDIQHILHQGLSYYNATFWVGANAVIRKTALEDIVEKEWIGGFEVKRYIQDRTVIEDTESSIDLTLHGWTLVNYPERLSYSATPPDFGSLIVQRRRWANGGLIILPKLWSQTKRRKLNHQSVSKLEVLLRFNYMASIAWASFGLIFLLAFPYPDQLLSPFIVIASVPYFLAMASDLHYCGYKRSDVFRIYGFNFVLLTVNLAGVLKSLQQALTGKKIPFARTPKVNDRTAASGFYIIAPLLIVFFSVYTLWHDSITHTWGNAAFAAFNCFVTTWAIIAYIGIKNALSDMWHSYINWLFIEVKKDTTNNPDQEEQIDWRAVLYHGDNKHSLPLSAIEHATGSQS